MQHLTNAFGAPDPFPHVPARCKAINVIQTDLDGHVIDNRNDGALIVAGEEVVVSSVYGN